MNCELHTSLLLLTSTTTTILRACLVELPGEVYDKGATGRITESQLAWTIHGAISLIGVEDVVATQVESERTQTAQIDVALNTQIYTSLSRIKTAVA